MGIQESLIEKQKLRIAELEQQSAALRAAIGQAHVDRFMDVLDGFMLVIQQAERGDPNAKTQATNFVNTLNRARATVSGIALPAGAGVGDRPSAVAT